MIASHTYQITKNITTYEVSNLGRFGHMGTRGLSASAQEGFMAEHAHAQSTTSGSATPADPEQSGAESGHVHGPACRHGHSHSHGGGHRHSNNPLKVCSAICTKCMPSTLLAIVGLDLYTKGRGAEGMARAAQDGPGANPFDVGLMGNCTDFWTRGRTR